MYTTQKSIINGITWQGTGEIIDRVSIHDWEEIIEGQDAAGYWYEASATVSCGEIIEIHEPERVE